MKKGFFVPGRYSHKVKAMDDDEELRDARLHTRARLEDELLENVPVVKLGFKHELRHQFVEHPYPSKPTSTQTQAPLEGS